MILSNQHTSFCASSYGDFVTEMLSVLAPQHKLLPHNIIINHFLVIQSSLGGYYIQILSTLYNPLAEPIWELYEGYMAQEP